MDLSLSEEQQLLKDSAARFMRDHGGVEEKIRLRGTSTGFSGENWKEMAELGWLALPFAEEDGGLGGNAIDLMVLCEEIGRGVCTEPYLVNIVCAYLLSAGSDRQRGELLAPLLAGESQWAFAFVEGAGRHEPERVSLRARQDGETWVLDGEKTAVLNGHAADFLLITARSCGEERDRDGISLFVVPADAPGVERVAYAMVDGSRGARVRCSGLRVSGDALIGAEGGALPIVEDVIAKSVVAIGAEALGAMEALLQQTVEYTKTRVQFGQPIGKFQALQHRMADMYLQLQSTRALLYNAAIARAENRPEAMRAAHALKYKSGQAGRFVSQQAVQLHGGIGMTDDLAIGHYFKRLLLLNTLFGDADYHLRRYMELGDASSP